MRKQIFATAAMRRPIRTENDQAGHEANCRAYATADKPKVDHDIIVKLALRIAIASGAAQIHRERAARFGELDPEAHPTLDLRRGVIDLEQQASSLDSDICQLCVEMQRACRGEVGPFPSDSWSHLNEG